VVVERSRFDLNLDGELVGPVLRRTWLVVPGAWWFVAPPADAGTD